MHDTKLRIKSRWIDYRNISQVLKKHIVSFDNLEVGELYVFSKGAAFNLTIESKNFGYSFIYQPMLYIGKSRRKGMYDFLYHFLYNNRKYVFVNKIVGYTFDKEVVSCLKQFDNWIINE